MVKRQALTQHELEAQKLEAKAESANGFLPTEAESKRALKLHRSACDFRAIAQAIKGYAPARAETLEKRARLMQLKAAMILLGEDRADDDDD